MREKRKDVPGTVYLIHFERPIGSDNPRGRAQHYIGWSESLDVRVEEHMGGRGARIVKAAIERGVVCRVVRTWTNQTRNFERKVKNKKCAKHFCPECRKKIFFPYTFWI